MISAILLMAISGSFAVDLVLQQGDDDDDALFGSDADDGIAGEGGNDRIGGGAGDDVLTGGAGNDAVDGSDGDDLIAGMSGDDDLFGGRGDDEISGGDGQDFITGGRGVDTIFGGNGIDEIYAQRQDDNVDGGSGNDRIGAGRGNDIVFGGAGDDTIDANLGDDIVSGGFGNDTIFAGQGDDFVDADEGDDTVTGGAGDDEIWAGSGFDIIEGDAGNDILRGGSGSDELLGERGNDTLITGTDTDRLDGGRGNDVIVSLNGEANDLNGGDGRDTFVVGAGSNSTIYDFEDGERLIFDHNPADGPRPVLELIDFGGGSYELLADDEPVISIFSNVEGMTTDVLEFANVSVEGLDVQQLQTGKSGGPIVDVTMPSEEPSGESAIIGSEVSEFLPGTQFDDRIEGLGGSDEIQGDLGDDVLIGGEGYDRVYGNQGNDLIYTNVDGDWDDVETGEGADIVVVEGSSFSTFDTTFIHDYSYDEDQIVIDYPASADAPQVKILTDDGMTRVEVNGVLVLDIRGEGAADVTLADIVFKDLSSVGTTYVEVNTAPGRTGVEAPPDLYLIGTKEDDEIAGGDGNDQLFGLQGKDQLSGGAGQDALNGGNQADILRGDGGNDLLEGERGNDMLFGGEGDDLLIGGGGFDVLNGGAGDDILVDPAGDLNGGAGDDVLFIDDDPNTASRLVRLSSLGEGEDVVIMANTSSAQTLSFARLADYDPTEDTIVFDAPEGTDPTEFFNVTEFGNGEVAVTLARGPQIEFMRFYNLDAPLDVSKFVAVDIPENVDFVDYITRDYLEENGLV